MTSLPRLWRSGMIAFLLIGGLGARGSAQSARPDIGAMARREAAYLASFNNDPLTAAERQQALAIAEVGLRANSAAWLSYDARNGRIEQWLAARDFSEVTKFREPSRLNAELGRADVPGLEAVAALERPIIRARDPVVAFVSPNLVTRQSVTIVAEAMKYMAKTAQLQAPPPNFQDDARVVIARDFATYPPTLQSAYANIGRNAATATLFLSQMVGSQVVTFLRSRAQTASTSSAPGAYAALAMQDAYNETVRRNWHPRPAAQITGLYQQMYQDRLLELQARGMRNAYSGGH